MLQRLLFIILYTYFIIAVEAKFKQRPTADNCCEYYCYDLDNKKPQFGPFGTYTAYPDVKESDFRKHVVPNCQPIKIWLLNRHGTRYPSEKAMNKSKTLLKLRDEIVQNYENEENMLTPHKGRLCSVDLELLKNWEWDPDVSLEDASHLAPRGEYEAKRLAQQYKSQFAALFDKRYNTENYLVAYTIDDRVVGSFTTFMDGLFGDNATDRYDFPKGREIDMVLQAYEFCKESRDQTALIFEKGSQLKKYQSSPMYKRMVQEVSWRLGFENPLKKSAIYLIWNMCRYDQSWHIDRPSPWCAAFTPSHIGILEYGEDIIFYYRKSYGSPINKRLACSTLSDMLTHLETNESPKAILYFTHSTLIYLMVTIMGSLQDSKHLRYNNYDQMHDRLFRSSKICPFGAHLAAVKYDCPYDPVERYKVMFLLNQKILPLEWCENGLCNWSDVIENYGMYMSANCEEIFCKSGEFRVRTSNYLLAVFCILSVCFLREY